MAPLAAIAASTIDWSKRPHSSRQTHFKFVDVTYSGSVYFLLHKDSRCYSRLGSDTVNLATTVLEKRSQAPFAQGKRRSRVLDVPVHRPIKRQNPTLGIFGICLAIASRQEDCRDSMPHSL